MIRRTIASIALCMGVWVAGPARAFDPNNPFPDPIPKGSIAIELQTVASGLVAPILLVSPEDGTNRQFIADQIGRIHLIKDGVQQSTPVLDLSSFMVGLNANYDERGLLGLAFDPDFAKQNTPGFGRIFTYTSESVSGTADFTVPTTGAKNHQSVLASWKIGSNPDLVDPASREVILRIDQPQSNHNGGMIAFGPDGHLYIALGDGGGANDTASGHTPNLGNGQDTSNILSSIVRIDVNGTNAANGKYGVPADNPFVGSAGVDEIYAYGLRNPYRFSFDGERLIVADVGQRQVEEVNIVTKGGNYGWNVKEGRFRFITDGTISDDLTGLPPGLIDPVLEYDHSEGIAIVGGFVYRGTAIPELYGKYVFGDYSAPGGVNGQLFYGDLETGDIHKFIIGLDDRALGQFVKGLGVDQDGELYVLASIRGGPSGTDGVALKIVAVPEPAALMVAVLGALLLLGRRRVAVAATLAAGLAIGVVAHPVSADQIEIRPIKDNTLYQSANGSLSNGAGVNFYAGTTANGQIRRGLLAFDIASSIPAGSTIDSVALTLRLSKTMDSQARTFSLHRALQDWGQGTSNGIGAGAPATAGDATWLHTHSNASFWANPGGDFAASPSASHLFGNVGSYTFSSTSQLVADVQMWLDSPGGNFGWFLIGGEGVNTTARQFDSHEHITLANRPVLSIQYTVPEPAALMLLPMGMLLLRRRGR